MHPGKSIISIYLRALSTEAIFDCILFMCIWSFHNLQLQIVRADNRQQRQPDNPDWQFRLHIELTGSHILVLLVRLSVIQNHHDDFKLLPICLLYGLHVCAH